MTATIVVTGVAGFIGFHLATHLIQKDQIKSISVCKIPRLDELSVLG